MLWIILLALACIVAYIFTIKPLFYWKKKGIPFKTPVPLFGNFFKVMVKKQTFYESFNEFYNDFPNLRYNGTFLFNKPALLIRDLELIKQIGIKDFDYFTDHRDVGNNEIDPLFSKNLAQLNGQEWRDMRAMLSPAFTSSKIKAMFVLISECAQQMTKHFSKRDGSITEIEMKELFTRYTNDVIATCAFGVRCDSLKERDNSFFIMGKDATTFTGLRSVKMLIANFAPSILKFLKISVFPKYLTDFFMNVIKETISYRTEHNVIRPDMIHLLLEARKGKLQHEDCSKDTEDRGFAIVEESGIGKRESKRVELSDIDIAAQAFIFFFAGFETSSVILSCMATELAIHANVQEKLFSEVDAVMRRCDGKPGYEDVTGMKYMDMVVSETLRKWPAGPMTDRICTKPYKIKASTPEENEIELNVGDTIMIPILGLHRNEKFYPQAESFDPDRFSDENRHKIVPFTYLPFGIGPRACIGSRFALLEIKVLFVYMLWKFEFVPVSKTSIPIKLSTKSLRIEPENGFWLGLKPRF